MADAVTVIFEIASFSSVMVLIVLGLGVIASMMGIFNFAHGEFVLLGAYTVYLSAEAGLGLWSGMVAAPMVVGLFGFLMERIIIRRFYASPIIAMLGTYAIGLMIRETIRGLLGGQYKSIAEPIGGAFSIGGINFSIWRTIIIVATLVVLAASWWMLARTPLGPAHSGCFGKSHAGKGLRHLDGAAVRADVRVWLRACRAGGRIDRAAVSTVGRYRDTVSGAKLSFRDAGRRGFVPGAGAWGGRGRRDGVRAAVARAARPGGSARISDSVGNR